MRQHVHHSCCGYRLELHRSHLELNIVVVDRCDNRTVGYCIEFGIGIVVRDIDSDIVVLDTVLDIVVLVGSFRCTTVLGCISDRIGCIDCTVLGCTVLGCIADHIDYMDYIVLGIVDPDGTANPG
ncbi:hypothetical protein PPL_02314 [Heterostelium album PN500]|uniref:Uncharacterized protein n=1 Tax=Heterostelium pallidum (strain ATCC 26659 / Pp 5 / PN500) TaxID=670386 RepID=D3B1Y9_HETP5|nr:hypothetical protein PPL_02314 [Heterostelium album PN500]EFA85313.1 hypothetical protein PPL_02314 [Heterostelium album PN500]|eukprot:XP_020437422.1 hypothetical protein PPL_02314 [Heterostelium album PN500]